ncbi:MAG: GNAT family N-acetyltransferase [Paludibacter sp.]|jgi:hypothetical protein|nr:GNAT family N-acetyltransferase [Paludibacter sp.]
MERLLPADFTLERYGINVRFVNETDAEFIVALRTDEKLGKYIHQTSPDIEVQRQWIRNYKIREANNEDFYFIFEKPNGTRCGVCRIYDITEESFTHGSWLFAPQAPDGLAILSEIITKEIAFELFPQKYLSFDVRRLNTQVIKYHKKSGAKLQSQDELNFYYTLSKEDFEKNKMQFIDILFIQ